MVKNRKRILHPSKSMVEPSDGWKLHSEGVGKVMVSPVIIRNLCPLPMLLKGFIDRNRICILIMYFIKLQVDNAGVAFLQRIKQGGRS